MKKTKLLLFVAMAALFASCGTNRLTRGEQYAKFYEEKPVTLLVMPPINNSTNVDAKELLYTSISRPLAEAGYYVISPHLAMDIFKNESAYDAELFIDQDVSMFGRVFGADAVVFTTIEKWKKTGLGIETDLTYMVKSTHTNEILFEKTCELFLDLSFNSGNNSLLGSLLDLTVSAINTALTDHIVAARRCNNYIVSDFPRGKYNPYYLQDMDVPAEPKYIKRSVKE